MLVNQSVAITNQDSIPKGTIDPHPNGIGAPSPDALQKLLSENPKEPALIKLQADNLKKDGEKERAAKLYCKAAKLLLEESKIPAAISVKLMQWRIGKPKVADVEHFLRSMRKAAREGEPVNSFFCGLNIQESAALYSALDTVNFPPNHEIHKLGDLEDYLYFVISGNLKGSRYQAIDYKDGNYREPNFYLHENDFFGDVYPFDSIKKSTSFIETKSQVELLRIPKEKLRKICAKYPRLEHLLLNLLKVRSKSSKEESREKLRDSRRIQLKLNLEIEILLNGSQNTSIQLSGHTKDVSIGGICFVLDEMGLDSTSEISSFETIINYAKVQVNFPIEELKVSIPGTIVWLNTVSHEGRKTMALGIQFGKMSPKLKGLLMMFFNSFNKK
jgi:CRP-like cAMP-binding protein